METNELVNAQLTRRTFFKLSAVTAFGATIVGLADAARQAPQAVRHRAARVVAR